jgi:DNA repair protein RecN (Recombination protein N)
LNKLIKEFGIGTDKDLAFEQLVNDFEEAQGRIADLSGGEKRIAELETELGKIFKSLQTAAIQLSNSRLEGAQVLGNRVTAELSSLSMPNAHVEIQVNRLDMDFLKSFSTSGIDEVLFLFSPHAGANALPLSKIASGGEVSRLMLALEVVIAEQSPVGTYIFDEVDAGVGGKAAVDIGKRLAMLARHAQVIVVTHLPQVAVWADQHLLVHKDQTGAITESSVTRLDEETRLREIARMLAGQEESDIALKHAEELVKAVREFVIS